MSDAPRRLLVLLAVFGLTTAVLLALRNVGGYGLFDLLRGRPAPQPAVATHKPEEFTLPEGPVLTSTQVPGLARLSAESAQVAERVWPSVVSIASAITVRDPSGKSGTLRRLGAGIIVTPEGHVITANHVVRNFEAMVVRLSDDRQLPVEIVGSHPLMDIAVLKIIAPDKQETFPALPFVDDSDKVRQGEFAFSFGNPFGLRRSCDFGVISSKERSFSDGSADLFQTSMRMMPGHSGGPLVNVRGEIIGVNRANFGRNPGEASVGMAIVANDARDILLAVLRRGKPLYGHLGVHVDVPAVYGHLAAFSQDLKHPVQVNSVTPGSAAEKAGLRQGDIIFEFAGQPIDSFNAFKRLVRQKLAGEQVSIGIRRDGVEVLLTATMAELDSRELFSRWEGWTEKRAADYIRRSLGAEVSNLSAAQKRQLRLPAAAGGVVVREVLPRTPAHGLLRKGDVVEICNGMAFQNARQFVALLDQRPRPRIDLLITRPERGGGRSNLVLELSPFDVELEQDTADPAAGDGPA